MATYYTNFVIFWIVLAIFTFVLLLYVTAPYGRHTSSNWGRLMDNKIAWIVMELPALLLCPLLFFLGDIPKSELSYFLIFLWIFHYFNRTLIFPLRTKTEGKKMPLVIVFSALFFNAINGFICGYYLGFVQAYPNEWLFSWQFIVGVLIFFAGMGINWWSDAVLIGLRSDKEKGYKIPEGGLFRYISCPNLFGEIIEWGGFALMTWALPIFSFWIWTVANLMPRALSHHRWYRAHFEDYPKERKAVIPFLK